MLLTPQSQVFSAMVCYQFIGDDSDGQAQTLVGNFSFDLQGLSEFSLKGHLQFTVLIHLSWLQRLLSSIFNFHTPGIGGVCQHFQDCLRRVSRTNWFEKFLTYFEWQACSSGLVVLRFFHIRYSWCRLLRVTVDNAEQVAGSRCRERTALVWGIFGQVPTQRGQYSKRYIKTLNYLHHKS